MEEIAGGRPDGEDGDLVRLARKGDVGAFEGLVERYQRRATAVAYRLLSSREDAMDVVQDAFLKAYDRLDSLTRPSRFGPWLLRIVTNLALNFRRARALRKTESLTVSDGADGAGRINRPDPHAPRPPEEVSAKEMQALVAREIEKLPEMQRQALVLFAIEKMPQKEIASVLGCSVEAVKWHVFTARKKLKERLASYL